MVFLLILILIFLWLDPVGRTQGRRKRKSKPELFRRGNHEWTRIDTNPEPRADPAGITDRITVQWTWAEVELVVHSFSVQFSGDAGAAS